VTHTQIDEFERGRRRDVLFVERHRARKRSMETRDHPERRGFSCSVRAEKSNDLSFVDVEVEVADGWHRPITVSYTHLDVYKRQPLHNRDNYVVARPDSGELKPGFKLVPDLESFLVDHTADLVWVIGGAALFAKTLKDADELHLTQVDGDFHCTKFFPSFSDAFTLKSETGSQIENDITFRFEVWVRTISKSY